ncbi:MAG: hypothetical protein IRZ16_05420 [Myxococcaceae bacterium]|nr:hypothetical protein [Myxococcaceae bacterium]
MRRTARVTTGRCPARSLMRGAGWLAAAVLFGAGCATDIAVDPEGYKCDVGNQCPPGYTCVSGVCHATKGSSACSASQCTTPPANRCKDDSTLIAFAPRGSCDANGACTYGSNEVACEHGCVDGACRGDPCLGMSCDEAPPLECVDADTARVYVGPGTCDSAAGQCRFTSREVSCPGGCAGGECKGLDLCANVTCDMPPAPVCMGQTLVTFGPQGTCNPDNGQCVYAKMSAPCPGLCVGGACVAATRSFAQVGPRVRSAVTAVDLVSPSAALVVGPNGYAARWDGSAFTPLVTNTVQDLTSVWMRSANVAYIVGDSGTALRVDGTTVTPLALPGVGGTDLVSVHGSGASHVLIAGKDGSAWRSTDGTHFTQAPAPPSSYSYSMVQAWVDSDGSERIAGQCTTLAALTRPCLLYADDVSASSWYVDPTSLSSLLSAGFSAVGPSLDSGYAFVSQGTTVYRHDESSGDLDQLNTPSGFVGSNVVGIAGDSSNANAAFFTVSGSVGTLYRWVKGSAPTELLTLYLDHQAMSRNDSGGVLVADSGPTAANIFRRGAITYEALDLAEDWVDVDVNPAGRRVFVNAFGDLAVHDPGKDTFDFARSPFTSPDYEGVVGANAWVLLFGANGKVVKFTPSAGYVSQSGGGTQDLHAGCRNTDSEVFLVGEAGKILKYDGTTLTAMNSGTAADLFAVACAGAGEAFAAGADGVVLKLNAGVWSKAGPPLPTSGDLRAVYASPTDLFVAGDNLFYAFHQSAWKALPGKSSLTELVGISETEFYAAAGGTVARFDGNAWTTAYIGSRALVGSAVGGGQITFVGAGGLIVESQ